jgi:hypothetical protein
VAIDLDDFYEPVLKKARKCTLLPIDGVFVRDWNPDNRQLRSGAQLGLRVYQIEGVRFAEVNCRFHDSFHYRGLDFVAVDRKDYAPFYKIAIRCRRDSEPANLPPILSKDQADSLWKNTIGYLDPANLRRIQQYGGRARRGLLLMGSPETARPWLADGSGENVAGEIGSGAW